MSIFIKIMFINTLLFSVVLTIILAIVLYRFYLCIQSQKQFQVIVDAYNKTIESLKNENKSLEFEKEYHFKNYLSLRKNQGKEHAKEILVGIVSMLFGECCCVDVARYLQQQYKQVHQEHKKVSLMREHFVCEIDDDFRHPSIGTKKDWFNITLMAHFPRYHFTDGLKALQSIQDEIKERKSNER